MRNREIDCKVCYGPHDAEIHEATLSVHAWFRQEVTLGFPQDEAVMEVAPPVEAAVA